MLNTFRKWHDCECLDIRAVVSEDTFMYIYLSGKIKVCQNVPNVPFSGMRNYFECHEVQARDIATKFSTLLHIDIYYMIIEIICCFWCICGSRCSYRRRCICGLTCIYVSQSVGRAHGTLLDFHGDSSTWIYRVSYIHIYISVYGATCASAVICASVVIGANTVECAREIMCCHDWC